MKELGKRSMDAYTPRVPMAPLFSALPTHDEFFWGDCSPIFVTLVNLLKEYSRPVTTRQGHIMINKSMRTLIIEILYAVSLNPKP